MTNAIGNRQNAISLEAVIEFCFFGLLISLIVGSLGFMSYTVVRDAVWAHQHPQEAAAARWDRYWSGHVDNVVKWQVVAEERKWQHISGRWDKFKVYHLELTLADGSVVKTARTQWQELDHIRVSKDKIPQGSVGQVHYRLDDDGYLEDALVYEWNR